MRIQARLAANIWPGIIWSLHGKAMGNFSHEWFYPCEKYPQKNYYGRILSIVSNRQRSESSIWHLNLWIRIKIPTLRQKHKGVENWFWCKNIGISKKKNYLDLISSFRNLVSKIITCAIGENYQPLEALLNGEVKLSFLWEKRFCFPNNFLSADLGGVDFRDFTCNCNAREELSGNGKSRVTCKTCMFLKKLLCSSFVIFYSIIILNK